MPLAGSAQWRPPPRLPMSDANPNARLEAFCDGVFAIALTLLIIEIRPPSPESIGSTAALWDALGHMAPSIFAFVLSFGIILITWVNHHQALKMVRRSCPSFIYANGFLLLTVVFIPFPTALMGEFLLTGHAAPAVALYNAVLALQSVGWILIISASLRNHLTDGEHAAATARDNRRNGFRALVFYTLLAVAAFWFPVSTAFVTMASWVVWLVIGIRLRHV